MHKIDFSTTGDYLSLVKVISKHCFDTPPLAPTKKLSGVSFYPSHTMRRSLAILTGALFLKRKQRHFSGFLPDGYQ
jgi:hypothetical protein